MTIRTITRPANGFSHFEKYSERLPHLHDTLNTTVSNKCTVKLSNYLIKTQFSHKFCTLFYNSRLLIATQNRKISTNLYRIVRTITTAAICILRIDMRTGDVFELRKLTT